MLKKSVLVVALFLAATNLWAAKTMDVSGTRHNLSSTSVNIPGGNYYAASNEDEVCIFCHTPHGGTMDGPLWNRAVPTSTGFTHYASATLSPYMKGVASREVKPESLLCMGCHDGTISMNSIINNSNRTGAAPDNSGKMQTMFFGVGSVIGDIANDGGFGTLGESKNLTDDHPISFSYSSAFNDTANTGKLQPIAGGSGARDKGIRFFGPDTGAGNFVECSSCHDPHVNYEVANGGDAAYTPFLVMSNAGSALCLACHIK